MARVRDEQRVGLPAGPGCGQQNRLRRVAQRRLDGTALDDRLNLGASERSASLVLRDEPVDDFAESAHLPLARRLRDDISLGIDEHQGRPGPNGILAPQLGARVGENRVRDAVALNRRGDRRRIGLVLELRGMDAEDGEHVGVRRLERAELGQHMQAVGAARRPEVQQHEPTAQLREPGRCPGPQGVGRTQLGGADPRSGADPVGAARVSHVGRRSVRPGLFRPSRRRAKAALSAAGGATGRRRAANAWTRSRRDVRGRPRGGCGSGGYGGRACSRCFLRVVFRKVNHRYNGTDAPWMPESVSNHQAVQRSGC